MYTKLNNIGIITGESGRYNSSVLNPNVRYGKNAICDFKENYLENYRQPTVHFPELDDLKSLSEDGFNKKMDEFDSAIAKMEENEKRRSPLNFKLQYSPNSKVSKGALLGAAYEEMGQKTSIKTQDLTQALQDTADALTDGEEPVEMSAESLDLNNDGEIDLGEYASSILVSDKLSTGKIDGIINKDGLNESLAYGIAQNYDIAYSQYRAMYESFGLKDAARKFVSKPNNLVK